MKTKKKLIILLSLTLLFIGNIMFFAYGLHGDETKIKEQNLSETIIEGQEKEADKADIKNKLEVFIIDMGVLEALKLQELDEDEINRAVEQYAQIITWYDIPHSDAKVISNLVKEKYDLLHLVSIYEFLTDCEEGINVIREIYDIGKLTNFEGNYWLENAYNIVTEKKHGVLDGGEIRMYLKKGLTYEEIAIANKISRKGVKTIKEILDERVNGATWNDLFADIYKEVSIDKDIIKDEKDPVNIYNSIKIAQISNGDINEIYKEIKGISKIKSQDEEQKQGEFTNRYDKMKAFLKDNNLEFKTNETAVKKVKNRLPKNKLEDKEIQRYIIRGFTGKEIAKAVDLSNELNMSVEEILTQYEHEKKWVRRETR